MMTQTKFFKDVPCRRVRLSEREAAYGLVIGIIEQARREVAGNFTWAPGMSDGEKERRRADAEQFLNEWKTAWSSRVYVPGSYEYD